MPVIVGGVSMGVIGHRESGVQLALAAQASNSALASLEIFSVHEIALERVSTALLWFSLDVYRGHVCQEGKNKRRMSGVSFARLFTPSGQYKIKT